MAHLRMFSMVSALLLVSCGGSESGTTATTPAAPRPAPMAGSDVPSASRAAPSPASREEPVAPPKAAPSSSSSPATAAPPVEEKPCTPPPQVSAGQCEALLKPAPPAKRCGRHRTGGGPPGCKPTDLMCRMRAKEWGEQRRVPLAAELQACLRDCKAGDSKSCRRLAWDIGRTLGYARDAKPELQAGCRRYFRLEECKHSGDTECLAAQRVCVRD